MVARTLVTCFSDTDFYDIFDFTIFIDGFMPACLASCNCKKHKIAIAVDAPPKYIKYGRRTRLSFDFIHRILWENHKYLCCIHNSAPLSVKPPLFCWLIFDKSLGIFCYSWQIFNPFSIAHVFNDEEPPTIQNILLKDFITQMKLAC